MLGELGDLQLLVLHRHDHLLAEVLDGGLLVQQSAAHAILLREAPWVLGIPIGHQIARNASGDVYARNVLAVQSGECQRQSARDPQTR